MARQSKGITLPIIYKADLTGINKSQTALQNFGRVAAGIGAAAVGAVTGIAVAGVRAFADFDSALQQSVAIMGNVSDTMRTQMSEAAREVAKNTTFSAEEAAESYFFLASAGLDAEQSIAALPKVAAFAQAGMFDMATATDLLTDAQSALGLTSDDTAENLQNMAQLGDILVKANTLANASVSQFSEALTNKAAASMRSLNMETEEGVAVLAVFADQGIKGSQAGTTFNATIRGLTNGARLNAAAFAEMGVEVFNADGAMNSMADIVAQMEGSLGGLSVEQQRAKLAQMGFTEETLAGALALIGNSEAIREYEQELRNAGGTVDEVAAKQLETFSSQLELLKSQFTDIGIEVGSTLVPILTDLMTELGPVIEEIGAAIADAFVELAPVLSDIAKQIPGLVRAFIPLIPTIGMLAGLFLEFIATLLPPFVELFNELAVLIFPLIESTLPIIAEIFSLLAPIILELVAAFLPLVEEILPPIFEIIAALAPVVLALIEAFLPLIEVTLPILIGLIELLTPVLGWLAELFSLVLVHAIESFMLTLEALTPLMQFIAESFAEGWYQLQVAIVKIINNVGPKVVAWANTIVRALNRAIDAINVYREAAGDPKLRRIGEIGFTPLAMPERPTFSWNQQMPNIEFATTDNAERRRRLLEERQRRENMENWLANVPQMADGGIVNSETLALIGEAGPEAVIPLDRLQTGNGGSTYNITVHAGMGTNGSEVGREIVAAIRRYERTSGRVFASA